MECLVFEVLKFLESGVVTQYYTEPDKFQYTQHGKIVQNKSQAQAKPATM